ncbi:hypothetical protein AGIG_G5223 [Arapaima gigas]
MSHRMGGSARRLQRVWTPGSAKLVRRGPDRGAPELPAGRRAGTLGNRLGRFQALSGAARDPGAAHPHPRREAHPAPQKHEPSRVCRREGRLKGSIREASLAGRTPCLKGHPTNVPGYCLQANLPR